MSDHFNQMAADRILTDFVAAMFTALFVALKLTDQIGWSWWWVFAPIWGLWLVRVAVLLLIWWRWRKWKT